MGSDALLWMAAALAIAGVAVLRLSWERPARSRAWNIAGWGALLAAVLAGDAAAGEWGIAATVLVIMFAAFVVLAFAAAKPARKGRATKGRTKIARTSPRTIEETAPERRSGLVTFALAGPISLAASVLLALAVRAMVLMAGGAEADGNVAVLATVPIAWPILSFALLMMSRRIRQCALVMGVAAVSAPFLLLQNGTV
tara:strand:+ start:1333 stop:1926 length:594 start_codon:yes stop_codon:yes gene_type:complete